MPGEFAEINTLYAKYIYSKHEESNRLNQERFKFHCNKGLVKSVAQNSNMYMLLSK